MSKRSLNLTIILLAQLLLAACGSNYPRSGAASNPSKNPGQSTGGQSNSGSSNSGGSSVTFATIQSTILNSRCVVCHSTSFRSGGVSLSSHSEIMNSGVLSPGNPDGSLIVQQVQAGLMPKGGARLSDTDISNLRSWISAGAPNN